MRVCGREVRVCFAYVRCPSVRVPGACDVCRARSRACTFAPTVRVCVSTCVYVEYTLVRLCTRLCGLDTGHLSASEDGVCLCTLDVGLR